MKGEEIPGWVLQGLPWAGRGWSWANGESSQSPGCAVGRGQMGSQEVSGCWEEGTVSGPRGWVSENGQLGEAEVAESLRLCYSGDWDGISHLGPE